MSAPPPEPRPGAGPGQRPPGTPGRPQDQNWRWALIVLVSLVVAAFFAS
ncbi:MAG: hypothetical protein QOG03_119, partial [Actinomycetota bacterium]|nr:hypothetical protein [Actinomycetota bacterium]